MEGKAGGKKKQGDGKYMEDLFSEQQRAGGGTCCWLVCDVMTRLCGGTLVLVGVDLELLRGA